MTKTIAESAAEQLKEYQGRNRRLLSLKKRSEIKSEELTREQNHFVIQSLSHENNKRLPPIFPGENRGKKK